MQTLRALLAPVVYGICTSRFCRLCDLPSVSARSPLFPSRSARFCCASCSGGRIPPRLGQDVLDRTRRRL